MLEATWTATRRAEPRGPRQRDLMSLLQASGGATIRELHAAIPDPPASICGLRTLLNRMARRGLVRRRPHSGRQNEFVYLPARVTEQAKHHAFSRVVEVYFEGSRSAAIEALLELAENNNRKPSQAPETVQPLAASTGGSNVTGARHSTEDSLADRYDPY